MGDRPPGERLSPDEREPRKDRRRAGLIRSSNLHSRRVGVSPCRDHQEDVYERSQRHGDPHQGDSSVGVNPSYVAFHKSLDHEMRRQPLPWDHCSPEQDAGWERQSLTGRFANQGPAVEELLQTIQQLEARHGAHNRREGGEEKTLFSREIKVEPFPCRFKVPSIP